jgi:hypothetical protein
MCRGVDIFLEQLDCGKEIARPVAASEEAKGRWLHSTANTTISYQIYKKENTYITTTFAVTCVQVSSLLPIPDYCLILEVQSIIPICIDLKLCVDGCISVTGM